MSRPLLRDAGFTLTELAMVMLIVSILLAGMLVPFSAQMEISGRQETETALRNIREALIGFAIVNGRLPCPAEASLATGSTGVGLEATTAAAGTVNTTGPCGCTTATSGIARAGGTACDETTPGDVTGVLPWATLGVPEADYWSNRYTYRVTTRFGRVASGQTVFGCTPSSNPASAAFALCSSGNISVSSGVSGGTVIASSVPAIVVSHGKNMLGSYQSTGTQQSSPTTGTDEAENANGDAVFVSSGAIDDQSTWLPLGILMGRMLAAGRLP